MSRRPKHPHLSEPTGAYGVLGTSAYAQRGGLARRMLIGGYPSILRTPEQREGLARAGLTDDD